METLKHPLFAAVTGLAGVLLGIVVGRMSARREWRAREQLLREALAGCCFIRGQIEGKPKTPDDSV